MSGNNINDTHSTSNAPYNSYGMQFGPLKTTAWTFGVWKSAVGDMVKLTAISMAPVLVYGLIYLLMALDMTNVDTIAHPIFLIGLPIAGVLFNAVMGGVYFVTLDNRLHGNPNGDSFSKGFSFSLSKIHRHLLMIIMWLVLIGLATIPATVFSRTGAQYNMKAFLWQLFGGVIVVNILSARLIAAWPAMLCENVGFLQGIKRSITLTRGVWGHTILTALVFGVVTLALFFSGHFLTVFIGAYPGFGPYVAFAFFCTELLLLGSLPYVYQFTLYGALVDREAGHRNSLYDSMEQETGKIKESKPWKWIAASVGITAIAYTILFYFKGFYWANRTNFEQWQYIVFNGIIMFISPLVVGLYIKNKAQLSSGIVIGLNWVMCTLIAIVFVGIMDGFGKVTVAGPLLQNLFAGIPWVILGVIGSIVGSKIRYSKADAYLDELDDDTPAEFE